jgi:hypothetical protein
MATRFQRDYSGTEWREPGEGYDGPVPQKGLYPFTLERVQEHESKEGNESLKWTFVIDDAATSKDGTESYAGFRGYIYTNDEGALWKEQQIMVALGAIKPGGQYKGTLEGLMKKYGKVPVVGRLVRERYIPEDGEPEWTAKLTSVMRPRTSVPTGAQDDEEEIDDEDDERPARSSASRARHSAPEPEPADDEELDLDELAEELEGLSVVALKKRAKDEFSIPAATLRGMDKEDIIEAIMESLEEGSDEPEPEEEEPEPPKRSARARASSRDRSASSSRTSARGRKKDDEELDPPF